MSGTLVLGDRARQAMSMKREIATAPLAGLLRPSWVYQTSCYGESLERPRLLQRHIKTISELKKAIADVVAEVDEDLRGRVYENFQMRLQECMCVIFPM